MEPIECSETSDISFVTPGNYPKENILHTGHGESLKSRNIIRVTKSRRSRWTRLVARKGKMTAAYGVLVRMPE